MLGHLPRPPLTLDPLIAEAKRRMRRRRALLFAVALIVVGGGAAGATLPFGSQPSVVPRASAASYPGPAVRLASCDALIGPGCRSPQHRWAVTMSSSGSNCKVFLRHAGTRSARRVFASSHGSCGTAVWASPQLLLFEYGPHRVLGLDAATGKVRPVANLLGFVVSANEHWLAGELRPKGAPPLVAAISLRNRNCHVAIRAHGPNENFLVASGGGAGRLAPPTISPFAQDVTWIRGRNRHGRISVASGPGVGFTRDSKSLIVAVNRWSDSTGAYHRKLVQIPLSASQGSCPAVVTARATKASAFGKWPFFLPKRPIGEPLIMHIHRSGGRISSIKVTVNAISHNSVLQLQVLHGSPYGSAGAAPNHPAVFEERARMTNLPGHGDLPAGMPLATWTGTLSPTDWKGGCDNKQYEVSVKIGRAGSHGVPKVYSPLSSQGVGSPWFRCAS
jgi:hypothetical protein